MHGPAIHPEAQVSPDAILRRTNVIGPGAVVEPGCQLEDCILWPHARVVTGARLKRCIVRSAASPPPARLKTSISKAGLQVSGSKFQVSSSKPPPLHHLKLGT
jgi:NDP-sugar pyrophosphorylase family protein